MEKKFTNEQYHRFSSSRMGKEDSFHLDRGFVVRMRSSSLLLFLFTSSLVLALGNTCCGWAEKDSPVRTVSSFGAVGDGKADDTAAIQRAVDAGIGEIRLPRGTYRVTRSIEIELDRAGPISFIADGPATLLMEGAGPALRLIGTHEGTASPDTVKENVWQRQRTPTVAGLEIVGGHPQAIGISAEGTMQAVFTRVTIRRVLHGIHLIKRNRNIIISDCHIYENEGVGIFLDRLNLHQINITNCHISYNKGGGIVVRESEIRNLQVGICDIEGNMNLQGPPTANVLIDTTSGSVREGAIAGCTIQHSHLAPDSANIRFIGRSAQLPLKAGNFTIADNVLSDVCINIHLQFARGVVITGNTLWKGFAHNLLVEGSSNIVAGPNLFDRNPDYQPPDSANGLLFRDCRDCTLTGLHINNTIETDAGLILQRCRRFNITNCTILDCDSCGILLEDVHNVRVSDCMIVDSRPESDRKYSLRLIEGRGNMIVDNLMDGTCEIAPGSAFVKDNQDIASEKR